ncbi:MAG: endonuclease III [Leptospirales bacterium]
MPTADRKHPSLALILERLSISIREPRMELDASNAFELLVSTVLSAQSTDRTVNSVTPALFRQFPDARSLSAASVSEVEGLIRATGFFRRKAAQIIRLSLAVCDRFGGTVPLLMEDLLTLPGVGRKTASVVLAHGFGIPAVPVDTHVARVSLRLFLTSSSDPERIEEDLKRQMPESSWITGSSRLLLHGRYVCLARKPLCHECVLADICPSSNPASS